MSISLGMIYNSIYLPGFAAALIANRRWRERCNCSRPRSLFYIAVMVGFGFWGSHVGAYFYNWVHNLMNIHGYGVRTVFGTIVIVIAVVTLCFYIEKLARNVIRKKTGKPIKEIFLRDTFDVIAPGAMILIATTKARCLWNGCCFGIPCSWGPYSYQTNTNVFPVQHVEILMSLTILYLTYELVRKNYYRRGMATFFAVGAWCIGRFFLEFLMYYPDSERQYFGFMSFWQPICILIAAVCAVIIVILFKRYPAEPHPKTKQKAAQRAKRKTKKHH